MEIRVNGEVRSLEQSAPLIEVLRSSGVENPDLVAVQLNGEFVAGPDLPTTPVKEGDEVEYLFFVGGGAR